MEFGICFDTHIDKWDLIRYVEELGYDRAWVPDSQMIWSDCYATMALAAQGTKRIKIGTGVAIPGTRIAPVTAHSIATINQIAPGRVFLGIGTGHTAMRVMGQHPMPLKEFREYLRVVRAAKRRGGRLHLWWRDPRDYFPPSRSPLHQPRNPDSDLCCGQWSQGVRSRGDVR